MSAPHRLDIFKHGHRAVCSGVLIGSLLDVLEVEAVVEVVQSWAAEQSSASAMSTFGGRLASSAQHHQQDERLIAWTFKHGHRAVCSGVLVGDLLDVLEVEAGFEVVQSWAAEQSSASEGGGRVG